MSGGWIRKGLASMACMILAFFFAVGFGNSMQVLAADTKGEAFDDKGSVNGVNFTVETDKDAYDEGELATVSLTVENTNSYDLSDFEVRFLLPKHLSAKDESKLVQKVEGLAAGEKKTFEIKDVIMTQNPDSPSKKNSSMIYIIGIVVGVVVVLFIVLILLLRKKKLRKAPVSAIMVLVMLTGIIAQGIEPVQAYTEDGLAEYWDYSRISCHDPSIVKDPESGRYYVFGSHLAAGSTEDLIKWSTMKTNINDEFEELFAEPWAWSEQGNTGSKDVHLNGQMWAPDIIWNENMQKWCMYMSIDGNNWMTTICLLTADEIEGPYEYKGIVVYSGMNNQNTKGDPNQTDIYKVLGEGADLSPYESTNYSCINAIDPCVKFDENGDLWMSYGSWSAGIYMLKLDKNTGLRDYNTKYETVKDESDAYFGKKIAGGYYASGEGSYLLKVGDYWYLFMSYGGLESQGGYQMRVFRSEKIDGPYVDQNGTSAILKAGVQTLSTEMGVKLFGSYEMPGESSIKVAQGHNSAILDDDGRIFLIYHSRFASKSGNPNEEGMHSMYTDQLFQTEDGWLVAAPYDYAGEKLDPNLKTEDVVGEYAFVEHDPLQFYKSVKGSDGQYKKIGIVQTEGVETQKNISLKKEIDVEGSISSISCSISYTYPENSVVRLNEDGTVTGIKNGTWEFTTGGNVKMTLDDVSYTGVFLRQRDDTKEKNVRMTFSILGDNVTAWGVWTDAQAGVETESE